MGIKNPTQFVRTAKAFMLVTGIVVEQIVGWLNV
jgi:hypothetical protein